MSMNQILNLPFIILLLPAAGFIGAGFRKGSPGSAFLLAGAFFIQAALLAGLIGGKDSGEIITGLMLLLAEGWLLHSRKRHGPGKGAPEVRTQEE